MEKKDYKDLEKIGENSIGGKIKLDQNVSSEKNFEETKQFNQEQEAKKEKAGGKFGKRNDNLTSNKFRSNERQIGRKPFRNRLQTEKLGTWRRTKVTKGGRKFSLSSLVLVKDEEKKAIAFAYAGGKEAIISFRKSVQKAQKKLIIYFPIPPRTIPHDITVSYKATKVFLKPAPPGSGIKAGSVLNKLFKFLEIKDVSAKIIGSRRNKLNVMRAAMMALDKLTAKKYEY